MPAIARGYLPVVVYDSKVRNSGLQLGTLSGEYPRTSLQLELV